MELCDVAEERGLGEGASNEGVHRLGDTLEREHLRDEQVHDVGFDAGAVLQRSGHLVGEACARLGVAARAVLDLCVGVTHDLLEHDVDEGAPLVAEAGGVGEVFATAPAASTLSTLTYSRVRVLAQRSPLDEGPLPLAPGRVRAVSVGALRGGEAGVGLLLGVCFSMNTAINSSNSISRASNRARLSALILPAAHSDSKRAFSASNSARSEDLFTVAIAAGLPRASTAIIAPSTARRSATGSAV